MEGDELQRITERFADAGYLLRVQEEGSAWVASYAPGEEPGSPVADREYYPGASALEAAQAAEAAIFRDDER